MAQLKVGTAYTRMFLMVQSVDHITALTGASPVVNLSKAGGAFFTATNSPATEVANGWYRINISTTDSSQVGDLAYHITAASGDPTDFCDQILSHLISDINIDASGNVSIASNIKKNQALNGFPFIMTQAGTTTPMTGLSVTAQRSLAGAGFAPCANAVTEVGFGTYAITLGSTDLNAGAVMLRFSAAGANDVNITLITQP